MQRLLALVEHLVCFNIHSTKIFFTGASIFILLLLLILHRPGRFSLLCIERVKIANLSLLRFLYFRSHCVTTLIGIVTEDGRLSESTSISSSSALAIATSIKAPRINRLILLSFHVIQTCL